MKRILLAYDGGEPARRALATAADLAKKFEARLTVISVVPVHPGRSPIDPWDDGLVHAQELKEAGEALKELGVEAELIEPSGDPATVIERVAEQIDADAVVVGSRGLSAVGRVLQGSVSQHVATHAAATVIVAR
jgi:nucleotide-binding universal stress UspA family protein